MKRLQNKVAVITGAASGLGRSIALMFASEGAAVLAADLNEQGLQSVAAAIKEKGGVVETLKVNMAVPADVEQMIDTAVEQLGTVDILVNNAGIMDDFSPVAAVKDEQWNRIMEVNVNGPFRAMRKVIPLMLEKKSGVIINIASVGGLYGARAGAAYTTSKHALIGLTKNTGYLYARTGIRCNAIAPGAMETHIADTIDMSKLHPLVMERIMPGMALNPRNAKPEEVAALAVYLATEDASFVNGAVLTADGGWTAF